MESKKATLEELLKRKMKSENDRNAFFPIESKIGLTFMAQKLPIDKVIDMFDDLNVINGKTSTRESFEGPSRLSTNPSQCCMMKNLEMGWLNHMMWFPRFWG